MKNEFHLFIVISFSNCHKSLNDFRVFLTFDVFDHHFSVLILYIFIKNIGTSIDEHHCSLICKTTEEKIYKFKYQILV